MALPAVVTYNDQTPFFGMATLLRLFATGIDMSNVIDFSHYDSGDANMLMGLSLVFSISGKRELAGEVQRKALRLRQLYRIPAAAGSCAIRLLAIMRPGYMRDNTPLDFLIEDSDVALDLLYLAPDLPFPSSLPEHDVLFVAIAPSDENQALLEQVRHLVQSASRPVLNRPERIAALARDRISKVLAAIPGVVVPDAARIDRDRLLRIGSGASAISDWLDGGGFPLLVRPLASQAGEGLERAEQPADLLAYLEHRPEAEFFVSHYIDYRSADGWYRKCRIAMIDGKAWVAHQAISNNWMVHYQTAGMAQSASKREQEACFMATFEREFGHRHRACLEEINRRIGLDYLVIDCAETADGQLLFFEADNIGIVHAMDAPDLFPYKQVQMRRVFAAFRDLLGRAGRTD